MAFSDRWDLTGPSDSILAATVYKVYWPLQSSMHWLLKATMWQLLLAWMMTAGCYRIPSVGCRASFPVVAKQLSPTISGQLRVLAATGSIRGIVATSINCSFRNHLHSSMISNDFGFSKAIKWRLGEATRTPGVPCKRRLETLPILRQKTVSLPSSR